MASNSAWHSKHLVIYIGAHSVYGKVEMQMLVLPPEAILEICARFRGPEGRGALSRQSWNGMGNWFSQRRL